ncbi:hypothetical protein TW637 [Tropheryma whipplei TW08/27]|nr:hypothetical protein TW637 [Tropheryma whipplei TW08/27]
MLPPSAPVTIHHSAQPSGKHSSSTQAPSRATKPSAPSAQPPASEATQPAAPAASQVTQSAQPVVPSATAKPAAKPSAPTQTTQPAQAILHWVASIGIKRLTHLHLPQAQQFLQPYCSLDTANSKPKWENMTFSVPAAVPSATAKPAA